jgi:hypothetical protein
VNSQASHPYSIFDLSGKLLIQDLVNPNETINVSQLEQGIYFIMFKNNKRNIQKFIKLN